MKPTLFYILFTLFPLCSFAQSAKTDTSLSFIEQDLLKVHNKLPLCKMCVDSSNIAYFYDSVLTEKLLFYTSHYPKTIRWNFNSLNKETISPLSIITSSDSSLRIYTWDDMQGGTMRFNTNVFQYSVLGKVYSCMLKEADTDYDGNHYITNDFYKIYTLKAKAQVYYLAFIYDIGSTCDRAEGIQIFTIEKGKLCLAPIIKKGSVSTDYIGYEYDYFTKNTAHTIYFNSKNKSIYLPITTSDNEGNEQITDEYEHYHFNGKYFEKVSK